MIVVVDTNVFVRETHLLRKKGGLELVQLLHATNGSILIPEILQREYVEQSVKSVDEERGRVSKAFSTLETLLGVPFDHSIPDGKAVRLGTEQRLRALETLTLSDPLTTELKAAAGTRSLENRPPTSKTDHGYKDCLIWESVLRLPPGSQVWLISKDKGFFNGDAIYPELIEEARERDITVVGTKNINVVVGELIKANPDLDLAALKGQDFSEQTPELVEEIIPPAPAPAPPPAEATGGDQAPAEDVGEIAHMLSDAEKRFDGLDLKVLAYIAYFDSLSKDDLFAALADADVAPDVARNIAERLTMMGFVRDTGNHYLVIDRSIGELAAPTVEAEIIAGLQKERRRNEK